MEAPLPEHEHPDLQKGLNDINSSLEGVDSQLNNLSERLTVQEERPLNITIKGISMSGRSEITFTEVT